MIAARGVGTGLALWGRSVMRFILGVIVGACLAVGSAYLHDTGRLKVGPKEHFVNWDTVIGLLPH
jgi:hypothetical protein